MHCRMLKLTCPCVVLFICICMLRTLHVRRAPCAVHRASCAQCACAQCACATQETRSALFLPYPHPHLPQRPYPYAGFGCLYSRLRSAYVPVLAFSFECGLPVSSVIFDFRYQTPVFILILGRSRDRERSSTPRLCFAIQAYLLPLHRCVQLQLPVLAMHFHHSCQFQLPLCEIP